MENNGQNSGSIDADIDASPAWNVTTSASNIVVAVIDSGVRITHEDLAPNIWTNSLEIPNNGTDDDSNGVVDDVHGFNAIDNNGNLEDGLGHGTKVAGAIGGIGNNHVGVAHKTGHPR